MANGTNDWNLVQAVVTKDAEIPSQAIEQLGQARVLALLTAGTMVAVERKFQSDGDARLIPLFVKELKTRFADRAKDIKPMAAEAVIRAALGEPELLDELDTNDMTSMMILVTYAIVSESQPGPIQVDAFCHEVIELADELGAQSQEAWHSGEGSEL